LAPEEQAGIDGRGRPIAVNIAALVRGAHKRTPRIIDTIHNAERLAATRRKKPPIR
jgi:hypothetical protein